MTGVDIDFKWPDLEGRLKNAEGEINLFLAAAVQTNRGLLFDSEGSYNGRPGWAPLSLRNGQILSDRGVLRKSIAPYNANGQPGPDGIVVIQPDAITVGTKLLYAKMMNYGTTGLPGGVLRPKSAKALKIPLPQGRNATDRAKELSMQGLDRKAQKIAEKKSKAKTPESKARYDKQLKNLYYRAEEGRGPTKFIFRKWVRIPARPFNDWNQQDQDEINEALLNKAAEVLNRD